MQRRNLIIIGVAVVAGILAVYLLNAYFAGFEKREEQIAQEQQLARIVVASQPLEFGAPLTTANVKLANWPTSSVPAGSFSSIEAAMADNRVALRPILAGEPILTERVSGKDGRASIAYEIPEGMRAVSIPVTASTSVSGFARPGDVVDVLLTREIPGGTEEKMTEVLLPNIRVLAIDQVPDIKNTKPAVGKTAVLLVDPAGAQALTLGLQIGSMSLILRNIEHPEADVIRFAGETQYLTTRDINRQRPRIRPAPEPRAAPAVRAQPVRVNATPGAPVNTGPSMTIFRGTQPTQYQVAPYGKW